MCMIPTTHKKKRLYIFVFSLFGFIDFYGSENLCLSVQFFFILYAHCRIRLFLHAALDGWLDADSISKVLVGIRGVEEDGVPLRVTRGSHFGREHGDGRQSRRKDKRERERKDQVGVGKENQGVGK